MWLIGILDLFILVQSTNIKNNKNQKTIESVKKKIMALLYQLASIRNKYCTYFKNDMGLFLVGTGTSCSGINTLSNVGLSTTYHSLIIKRIK